MLTNQHSLYVHFDKHYKICLFSYQKATNKFGIIFNMIYTKSQVSNFLDDMILDTVNNYV